MGTPATILFGLSIFNVQEFFNRFYLRKSKCESVYAPQEINITVPLHPHLSLNHGGRWDTADDPTTSFFYLSFFSTALWDFASSRPVHSLMLSSDLFFYLPCLLPSFTVPCNMVLARPDERGICPYHFSLCFFT